MFWQDRSISELRNDAASLEAQLADLRCQQVVLVNEADKASAPAANGFRSMVEWVQANLDVSRHVAHDLVFAARTFGHYPWLVDRMVEGQMTFARAVATVKLIESGASRETVEASYERDLAGVQRMTAEHKHMTRIDERKVHADRFFTIQPTLDESRYRMWGELPGVAGRTVEKAIMERAGEIHRALGNDVPSTRGQRQADALSTIARDSLDDDVSNGSSAGQVTVFVDARSENAAESAAVVEYGPRVGPNTLSEILCGGKVTVVGLDEVGTPVSTSRGSRAIPSAIRHTVALRDGGCVVDGCASRYRLQPHHVRPWSHGGTHDPANLATLCWFHHHIAVHQQGFHIDPHSPPLRRRLVRSQMPRGSPL